MKNSRLVAASLLAATAFAIATPAQAQRVDHIVAFGDSYADDGNLFQIIGINPPAPYSTGRFSGGTNYVDTLGQLLNAPIDNFAIGGALTKPTPVHSILSVGRLEGVGEDRAPRRCTYSGEIARSPARLPATGYSPTPRE